MPKRLISQKDGYLSPISDVFGVKIGGYYDIAEDWNGFIWMATNNGLLRIDGTHARVFTHSKTDSTLADRTVYDILIDENRKVIWLATAMGLTQFDPATETSKHYQASYDNPNSLADNIVRAIFQDKDQKIWVGCFNHGLSLYREETDDFENFYYKVPFIDSLQAKYPDVNESRLNSFKVIRQDLEKPHILWLSTPMGMVKFNQDSGEFDWLYLNSKGRHVSYLRKASTDFVQIGDKLVIGTHGEGFVYHMDTKRIVPINLTAAKDLDYVVEINKRSNGQVQITYLNGLCYFDPLKNRVLESWVDKPNQGKYYGVRMTDSEGRVWLHSSTTSSIYDPVKQISRDFFPRRKFGESPSVFKKLDGDRLALLNKGSNVCQIFDTRSERWQYIYMKAPGLRWENILWNDLIQLYPGTLLLLAEEQVYTLNLNSGILNPFPVDIDHNYPGFTKALVDKKGRLWIATRRIGLLRQDKPGERMHHFLDELNSEFSSSLYTWITDLLEDRAGNIWIRLARSYAIYETEKDRFRVFSHYKTPHKTFRYIRNFSEDPTGDVWVASIGTGLGRTDALRVEKGIVQKLSVRDGLFSDDIKQISFDQDANLWMLTDNGLSRFHSKNPNVWNYPWDRGIPIAHAFLTLDDGTLAIARKDGGLSLIDPENLIKQKNIPQPYFTSVIVEDQVAYKMGNRVGVKDVYIHTGRDYLSVTFSAFGYSNPKEFAYKLEGVDVDWVLSDGFRSTSYSNLSPKEYTFHLKSRLVGGDWSKEVVMNIHLVPKWYETLWFRGLAFACFLLLAYGIYRLRLDDVRRQERIKAEYQQRLHEVEMQSLRSQMNPHFLFNSLNSIQLYIIRNKPEQAVEYLGRFSRLMRLILQNSRSQTVTVSQELESLKLYMELENLRFSNMFEYEILVDPEVRVNDFEIPPMLLQPFIENAIWHGLQPKNDKGKLTLDIALEDEYLLCSIEDNGIGREASSKLKKKPIKQHKSMGMKITADRLEMINDSQFGVASMEIIDLYDEHEVAKGTRVIVRIPLQF